MKCNHIVGLLYDYEDTEVITIDELIQLINNRIEIKTKFEKDAQYAACNIPVKCWTLDDYADRRKNTDMRRFDFCPLCGEKIDWKALKNQ